MKTILKDADQPVYHLEGIILPLLFDMLQTVKAVWELEDKMGVYIIINQAQIDIVREMVECEKNFMGKDLKPEEFACEPVIIAHVLNMLEMLVRTSEDNYARVLVTN